MKKAFVVFSKVEDSLLGALGLSSVSDTVQKHIETISRQAPTIDSINLGPEQIPTLYIDGKS